MSPRGEKSTAPLPSSLASQLLGTSLPSLEVPEHHGGRRRQPLRDDRGDKHLFVPIILPAVLLVRLTVDPLFRAAPPSATQPWAAAKAARASTALPVLQMGCDAQRSLAKESQFPAHSGNILALNILSWLWEDGTVRTGHPPPVLLAQKLS